jgi:VIT1/CCC1 family predicted Fe2+/Mn2+ transporter
MVLIAGVAGLVAGAMSMAAGEYVSVSPQSDTEKADLARERKELSENAAGGANLLRATARVTFWGALAMALTAAIGKLFGTVV